jgi:AcrR family transcriptional regulator
VVRHLGADDRSSPRVRIVDAMLACLARDGAHKSTLDEVAKEAGLSRATLYRQFPGGKEAVTAAVVETEAARFSSALAVAMGEARNLEEALVSGIVEAARRIGEHAVLRYLLEHEPGVLLPHLAFAEMDKLLAEASRFAAPFLARWLEPEQASRAAEWAARIVITYVLNPDDGMDLAEVGDTRRLVRTYVMPGIQALRAESEAKARDDRARPTAKRGPAAGRRSGPRAAGRPARTRATDTREQHREVTP